MLFKNCQTSEKLLSAKQCKIPTAIWNYEITENVLHIIEPFSQNRKERRKLIIWLSGFSNETERQEK